MDLSRGGPSWVGWYFARFGRAREWRLHAPDGSSYTAGEIAAIRGNVLEIDYLRLRLRELERQLDGLAIYVSSEQVQVLRAAVAILGGALQKSPNRRSIGLSGVPSGNRGGSGGGVGLNTSYSQPPKEKSRSPVSTSPTRLTPR